MTTPTEEERKAAAMSNVHGTTECDGKNPLLQEVRPMSSNRELPPDRENAHLIDAVKWIPVSPETMPEYDTDVHLWAPSWPRVYLGYWRHSEEWIGRQRPETTDDLPDTNPTHWRPLPAPPKAEGGGK